MANIIKEKYLYENITTIRFRTEEFSGKYQINKQMTDYLYVNTYTVTTYHVKWKQKWKSRFNIKEGSDCGWIITVYKQCHENKAGNWQLQQKNKTVLLSEKKGNLKLHYLNF